MKFSHGMDDVHVLKHHHEERSDLTKVWQIATPLLPSAKLAGGNKKGF